MQGPVSSLGAQILLEGIYKRFANFVAIAEGLRLEIRKGEFISLLGPSGSGKSTLLSMIAGFEQPTAGKISIDGKDVTRVSPDKRNVGMVFQNYALFPHLTVAENVGFALKQRNVPRGEMQSRVQQALDLVQLSPLGGRFPQQLSGGQQQRVAIARAVIFNPPVLLMDEPLSALDKQLRDEMQLEIKHLHDRLGITFIYVTHDQKEALVMSDRVAVLNNGKVEQIGSPTALYDEPENQFVASFIGEANMLKVVDQGQARPGIRLVKAGDHALQARVNGSVSANPLCMVRPEKIHLGQVQNGEVLNGQASAGSDAASAGLNSLPGIVREATFMGDAFRYVIDTSGQRVIVKQSHRADLVSFSPGDHTVLSWAINDTRLI
jgi:spermidine/putrescine ABC transporter ATP-binding subunit